MRTRWKVLLGVLVWPLGIYWLLRSPSIGRTGKIAIASVSGLILVVIIIAASTGGGSSNKAASTSTTSKESTNNNGTSATTTAEAASATPQQKVKAALGDTVAAGGYAGDVKIVDVSFYQDFAAVTAKTPEGGVQGASCADLDQAAGAIFEKTYKDTGWKGNTTIAFEGGLVNKATGKELPHAQTGTFSIDPGQAKQIDWSNSDDLSNIDWSVYRDFCHPALNQ